MRRRWKLWLVGGLLLALVLAVGVRMGLDHFALVQRRHLLGTMQSACRLYAGDHAGKMPPDLRTLFPQYVNAPSLLAYATNDVDYLPGATVNADPRTVLLQEKRVDRDSRRWVAFVDMSLELVPTRPLFSPPP